MIYQDAGRPTFYMVAVGFSVLAFIGFLGQHLLDSNRDSIRYFKKRSKKTSL